MKTKRAAPPDHHAQSTPWLTAAESAARGRVGIKVIYQEVQAGRLRAARVGGRRDLRLLPEWIDEWLIGASTPVEIRRVS